jgi:hypothetical protein
MSDQSTTALPGQPPKHYLLAGGGGGGGEMNSPVRALLNLTTAGDVALAGATTLPKTTDVVFNGLAPLSLASPELVS